MSFFYETVMDFRDLNIEWSIKSKTQESFTIEATDKRSFLKYKLVVHRNYLEKVKRVQFFFWIIEYY